MTSFLAIRHGGVDVSADDVHSATGQTQKTLELRHDCGVLRSHRTCNGSGLFRNLDDEGLKATADHVL